MIHRVDYIDGFAEFERESDAAQFLWLLATVWDQWGSYTLIQEIREDEIIPFR